MTRFNRLIFFFVIDIPIVAAFVATFLEFESLYSLGGWFAVFGSFIAAWGSILLVIISTALAVFILFGLPLLALVYADIQWAHRVIDTLEKWTVPKDLLHQTDGYAAGEDEKTLWEDVFDRRLSYRASRLENICTAVQLGALPIAATIILIVLKVIFWIS